MDFGQALTHLKFGGCVARQHWEAQRYLRYAPRSAGRASHLVLHSGPGSEETWVPAHADLLATDWRAHPEAPATESEPPADTPPRAGDATAAARSTLGRIRAACRGLGSAIAEATESCVDHAADALASDPDLDVLIERIGRSLSSIDERRKALGRHGRQG